MRYLFLFLIASILFFVVAFAVVLGFSLILGAIDIIFGDKEQ